MNIIELFDAYGGNNMILNGQYIPTDIPIRNAMMSAIEDTDTEIDTDFDVDDTDNIEENSGSSSGVKDVLFALAATFVLLAIIITIFIWMPTLKDSHQSTANTQITDIHPHIGTDYIEYGVFTDEGTGVVYEIMADPEHPNDRGHFLIRVLDIPNNELEIKK